MDKLDIRAETGRPVGMLKTTTTQLRLTPGWIALRVGTRGGWFAFARRLKSGDLGRRYYIGMSPSFIDAIRMVRKHYGIKIPSSATWRVLSVKHYNLTHILEQPNFKHIVNYLKV
jgi:hypothetical protein|tara:strand:+ start:1029 stop:1373 length:345 start_codon:yes stop_codon:yes gene_type:complete